MVNTDGSLLTVAGVVDWTGGTMGGKTTVAAAGALRMTGGDLKFLDSGSDSNPAAITNLGSVVWTHSSTVYIRNRAQIPMPSHRCPAPHHWMLDSL